MFNWLFGSSSKPTVLCSIQGQLNVIVDGKETCLFKNAEISIKKGDSYSYALVVDNLGTPTEDDNLITFPLTYDMRFRRLLQDKFQGFLWAFHGKDYGFMTLSAPTTSLDTFYTLVLKGLYEIKHREDCCNATEEELFQIGESQKSASVTQSTVHNNGNLNVPVPTEEEGETEFRCNADFFLFDVKTQCFQPWVQGCVVKINSLQKFERNLYVCIDESEVVFAQSISSDMNMIYNRETKSVIWNAFGPQGAMSVSLVFQDNDTEREFKTKMTTAVYEKRILAPFNSVKSEDTNYLLDSYQDVVMEDAPDDDDKSESDEYYSSEEENEQESSSNRYGDGGHNSCLAVGFKNDRSYVVRGSHIGVFKDTNDRGLEFSTAISNVRDLQGKTFSPAKVMLHKSDRKLLLLNSDNSNSIYEMDLERGKIVEEWKTSESVSVTSINPSQKYAQKTDEDTFVGLNDQSIFRVDPRICGNKVVDKETYSYSKSTNPKLQCIATTGDGSLAVGSAKGDIRLFSNNGINKRAKTQLPGFGDPIVGIDVSEDGKYILATCQRYLLVIDTEFENEGKYSGFSKGMGAKKPAPKRLQLKPEHVACMNNDINFTHAHFNTGEGGEKYIVTSSGPYVITWNFRRVKQNRLFDYLIKQYSDNVVADQFQYNQDKSIVVALPDDVKVVTKTHMSTPTGTFALGTPRKKGTLRDSVVNSPY